MTGQQLIVAAPPTAGNLAAWGRRHAAGATFLGHRLNGGFCRRQQLVIPSTCTLPPVPSNATNSEVVAGTLTAHMKHSRSNYAIPSQRSVLVQQG